MHNRILFLYTKLTIPFLCKIQKNQLLKPALSLLLVSSLALTSCKNELEPQESTATVETITPEATAVEQAQVQQNLTTPNVMNSASPAQTTVAAPVQVAKGMNPAHGQPGHRCEIPVGAPLNSAPNQTQQQQKPPATVTPAVINSDGTFTQGSNSTITTSSNTTSGAPSLLNPQAVTPAGMNPPHGQDGHRCDIAVGAALPK